MAVRGIRKNPNEKPLLGSIQDILDDASNKGLYKDGELDIYNLVRTQDIEISEIDLPSDISGRLLRKDNKWIIQVNAKHNNKRKRFTVAHEFAHYVLHRDDKSYYEDTVFFRSTSLSPIEYKANEFAASLLMREDYVRDKIKDGVIKVTDLAGYFNVSFQAMKFRLLELGYRIRSEEHEKE